jgi:Flp pilus assembly protein TadG
MNANSQQPTANSQQLFAKALHKLKQFRSDRSGNFGIIFALSVMPIIMAIGMAIDYSVASNFKTKLNSTLDSTAIAGVTAAKNYFLSSKDPNISSDALNMQAAEAGKIAAVKFFNDSVKIDSRLSNLTSDVQLIVTDADVTATATYSADYNLAFGSFVGIETFKLENKVKAGTDLPNYLDVNIVMDISSSMGIGADQESIDKMKAVMNCEFACHVNGGTGVEAAHSLGAVLRVDVMRDAISNMIARANSLKTTPDLFQFSLYTFSNSLVVAQPKTIDYPLLASAMGALNLTTDGGGTNFHYSIGTQLPPLLPISGDGKTAAKRKSHVIIITDGVENRIYVRADGIPDWQSNWTDWFGNGPQGPEYTQAFDPSICDAIKATGATVSVLNVTYSIPDWVTSADLGSDLYSFIRSNILPNASTTIQKCASDPSRFYSANSTAEIKAAALTIFSHISKPTRLIN